MDFLHLKEKTEEFYNSLFVITSESYEIEDKFKNDYKNIIFKSEFTFIEIKEFDISFKEIENIKYIPNYIAQMEKIQYFFILNWTDNNDKRLKLSEEILNNFKKLKKETKVKLEFKLINMICLKKYPTLISIGFEIISFEVIEKVNLIEKKEVINEIENLKLELKNPNHIVIPKVVYNKPKSFNDVLDFFIELEVLRYNSRHLNSTLNSFQNKVFNEKNLNEFNSKKEILKNYIGLEFKTICEISEIREQIIDFNLYFRNKLFCLRDSRYNKILQKEVFFLKNNSSVEISFKIKDIKDDLTRFNIELLTIKKNNKVKLFGKFIRLEHFWLGIYLSLILYSLILFSKINFYGVIPLLFKITLGVLFGYIINKLLIKKIDDNY